MGDDAREVELLLSGFKREIIHALEHCHHHHGRPATITLVATQNGQSMGTYTAGTPVTVTATVKNDKSVNIPDTLSWSSDQGTVSAGPNGVDADGNVVMTATLVNAPIGTATVTATTSNGLSSTDAIVFTDPAAAVPASISLTDTAAA